MENAGIDPATSRMLSERSTIWANSPTDETTATCLIFGTKHTQQSIPNTQICTKNYVQRSVILQKHF